MQSNRMGHVRDTEDVLGGINAEKWNGSYLGLRGCPWGDKCRVTEWVISGIPRMS